MFLSCSAFVPFLLTFGLWFNLLQLIRFIDEDDLLRFMIKEEVDLVLPLFGTENGQIDRKALTDWVVGLFNTFNFTSTLK